MESYIPGRSPAKTVIPRDHLQLEEWMTSLVSLVAFISVATAAKQTIKSYN